MASAHGIAVGLRKGYPVEANENQRSRPSRRRRLSKRLKTVRSVIAEVAGLAPYEKRILDVLKTGGTTCDKRAYKMAKQRLGTHKRALAKRQAIKDAWAAARAMQ
mmetsp:Transcript_65994/g.116854  ORF Transcript_65994/g.116854 Transcript_65994/m.116854 type:complete len:105 (-) Transcript_65994:170-484(-)|eukprot:CAMPEP_0197669050 /NCGR_PEP_ID=MMETSP1338-20131121/70988_1 /TAXON_ID=43686 ORGANISM="Pelagodinium beii, Strain RCC1491" /NCGR_SAMPLE_ID=MMETSP1338 /ASSEMBLY_ACC=CAM_ASM_000754 /LENGTH=104 /DNA_ID=CAMNT_0043248537 /DNA_START=56 /DNA_END=370 /DNA_ORIENTATION=-